jgi:serine/threonine protein kinase
MIGQTISHYKILEKLGEGGMGVVYKAHDTELDRDVALKFLPRDIALSEDERARFKHEAKAASALDHPNICTIHEIATTEDGQMFIVMGYYEGDSLSKKIEKGRIDVVDAVWIAIQIAEGLHAAHGKGIIHRDIKSSNIIVSDQGQVRILDFGLAHKKGLSKLTKTGTTVGTASYMSPEQAQGAKIDHRTDLWSLGVILYEMITGHLPFRGEHEAAILYSVVNEEPQSIQSIVPDASPELVHIIRRALEKDPGNRYQSAADLLIDLRRLKKDTSRIGYSPVTGERKKLSARRNKILVAAGLLILLCVVGYLFLFKKGVEINPDFTSRWLQVPFNELSFPAISPDGKLVVFGAPDKNKKWDLYIMSATGGESRRLTQDSSDVIYTPSVSPDGGKIVYNRRLFAATTEICVISLISGTSKAIGIGDVPKWSPDGKRIGYMLGPGAISSQSKSGYAEFWTMNPDGTDPQLEFIDTIASRRSQIFSFAWSPDGGSVAWVRHLAQRNCEIVIHDLTTDIETPVISDKTTKNEICWTINDQLIYSSSVGDEMNLFMISTSGGKPVLITKNIGSVDFPTVSSDSKTLLFHKIGINGHLWLTSLDGSMRQEEIFSTDKRFDYPDISPNGKYIAMGMRMSGTLMDVAGTTPSNLFIMNRDGSNMKQITQGEIVCFKPRWSPNGKMISYYARNIYEPDDSFKVYVINPHRLDVPRFVYYGTNQTWVDSVTIQLTYQRKAWQGYVDGRQASPFSGDSMFARTICNGLYVNFYDDHMQAYLTRVPMSVCKIEDWDGIGPKNSVRLADRRINQNYDALYYRRGFDIFRISFHDWKTEKLNVNIQGIDTLSFFIRTTRDGKEMVYKTSESVSKLGVIENLFK